MSRRAPAFLTAVLHAEHKLVAGPRTLLLLAALFPLALVLTGAGADAALMTAQERWVRAALAAAGVVCVLAWAERDRPYRQDLEAARGRATQRRSA